MMEEEFVSKFSEYTGGKFDDILCLSSAVYQQSKFQLSLEFIAEYDKFRLLTDDDRDVINKALDKIFPKDADSQFSVSYEIKPTYAEESTIFNMVLNFLNKNNNLISKYIEFRRESLEIVLDPREIELKFTLPTAIYLKFTVVKLNEKIKNYLEHKFVQNFFIKVIEDKNEKEFEAFSAYDFAETVVSEGENRTINYSCQDRVFAKFRILSISKRAQFIMDAKPPENPSNYRESESVFCGKISNFSITKYENPKYNPEEPKAEPKEKVRANFVLDDTTGKINCVIFVKNKKMLKELNFIHDDEEVVCLGTVSEYNGKYSYSVAALFNAKIDYDSIVLDYVRPTPLKYKKVIPKTFTYEKVTQTMFDDNTDKCMNNEYFKGKTFVVFDTECTGKSVIDDEIIEIGAIKVVDGKVTESFETLINPGIHIPDELTEKVHHISDDMVAGKPTIYEVIDDFYLFTRGAILVGHNIDQFDYPFVNKYMQKVKFVFDNATVDTLTLARKLLSQETKKFDLATLSKLYSLTNESAHRALSDVIATYELLQLLSKKM